ncbi:MAG: hypothetical protein ACREJ4_05415 [Candidatus Methylomirabilaceae bacterium]
MRAGDRFHFYGFHFDHGRRRWVESLQIREKLDGDKGSRVIDNVLSGNVYRTARECEAESAAKNRRIGQGLKAGR